MNLEEDHYNPNFCVNSGIVCGKSVGEFPYNCIGALYYCDGADRQFIGSGFLITSNLMLTAAHNIYQRNIETDRAK
jgi:V8-like Glu-specific endopeptidase